MDRSLVPLGHTPPHALDLQQLRMELSALWREEGRGVLRACHATLVVIVSPGEDLDDLLDDLVLTHPSRVLRIERDPKLGSREVVAWGSGCCMKPSSGMLVCSETLHFRMGQDADDRLPSIVRSLAVGGVPLAVISRSASPLHLHWVNELGEDVNMVVGRSSALDIAEALELWTESGKRSRPPRVEDMTWDEIRPWRTAIQSCFDRPRELERLAALSQVTLEIGPRLEQSAPAWLLAGWLGSRLGWHRPVRKAKGSVEVERKSGCTLIEVRPALAADTVTFAFEDGGESIRFTSKDLHTESPSAPLSRTLHRHAFNAVAVSARNMARKLAEGT